MSEFKSTSKHAAGNDSPPPQIGAYSGDQIANVIAAIRELKHPTQIGPYRIIELIGEGGMGLVYRAEQLAPIQRIVALKLIKLGMDTREVIARFESERQALAMMDHPNVARVLDAGVTDTGRPYFVMEYVQGEPITAFADRQQLTVQQRLRLFIQACDAVQHAHQRAIIHRDLKPSNILVTMIDGKPEVKVIDFGVAKALCQRLTEKTFFTETGQLVGTPEYMAPEQADLGAPAPDVDTRSDVYSLGIVLYELLSGALPFDASSLRSAGYNEIQRIIREVDPPRPSTKLSSLGRIAQEVARLRHTSLDLLEKQLKSELEWIPLKAMRKDREQRYESATALAQDIRNYLEHRPLRAGPETQIYRARKFLRRNKTGVLALAAMLFLLLTGAIATTLQAVRATRAESRIRAEQARTLEQKQHAESASAAANQVNRFLVDMLQAAEPSQAQGKAVLVRDVLDKAAASVGAQFNSQPRVEAAVRLAIAKTYEGLGLPDQAEPHLLQAITIGRRLGGEDDPETIEAREWLGIVRHKQGKIDEALAIAQDVLARRRRIFGEDQRETIDAINNLGVILQVQGKLKEAEPMYRDAREHYRASLGSDAPDTLKMTQHLGEVMIGLGRHDEAAALLLEAYDGDRRTLGDDHPNTITAAQQLVYELRVLKRTTDAETLAREVFARSKKVFGEDHIKTIMAEELVGITLSDLGRHDEAVPLFMDSLARCRKTLGSEHQSTAAIANATAAALLRAGRPAEAEPLEREALAVLSKRMGPDHRQTIAATMTLVSALQQQEKWSDALPLSKDVYDRMLPPGRVQIDPQLRAKYLAGYGLCLVKLKRYAEALAPLMQANDGLVASGAANASARKEVLSNLLVISKALDHREDATRWTADLAALDAVIRPSSTQPATRSAAPG